MFPFLDWCYKKYLKHVVIEAFITENVFLIART
jgi:hypothetical protein